MTTRKMGLSVILSLLFFSSGQVRAEDLTVPPDLKALTQTGKILTVKYVPQDKNFQIFVVGKKAASIDLGQSDVQVLMSVNGGPQINIRVKRESGYFTSVEPIENHSEFDIEVKAKTKDADEKFKFRVINKPR